MPSWGGSLFEAVMPLLVLDELHHAPASLGRNARHTEAAPLCVRAFRLSGLGFVAQFDASGESLR
ncbi:MAG: hypothetical protein IPL59_14280 [Candidatus Competibacteraceae bacterium]|nr:hypothetical protein [Candidatus Competibacteraceae bacterium]